MGFFASLADPCIWMRQADNHYEYIAVYVDDLAIASKCPAGIIRALTEDYKFKLKGTGLIEFHLGCDFFRDEEGVSCFAPHKYIDKLIVSYERMFGSKPKTNKITSPLVKGDHPEIDDSAFLEEEGIQQYQSPRKGHLDPVKRICGYLQDEAFRHSNPY
jgi:hypothetical protein